MGARVVRKTCNICEATCGHLIEVEANRVRNIRADDADPFSRGHICPKAIALRQVHEDPDRLRFPVRRTAKGWQRISWEEALDEATSRLAGIQHEFGEDAVASYLGNPAAHDYGLVLYLALFNRALRTRNRYSASSLDQNPKHASSYLLYGNVLSIPVPDVDRTDFMLILGANPMVSNGGLFTAPGFRRRAAALKERGGRIVVVDPRRTETAEIADDHLFIRPGRDVLLLCALLHTFFDEGLVVASPALSRARGAEGLEVSLRALSPEAVEPSLGIAAARVRSLARDFALARRAVCYGRFGTTMTSFGTLNSWLIDVVNLLTGNLDTPGGAMFATPAADLAGVLRLRGASGSLGLWKTRVRGAPAFNDEQPSACLAEEIETPGEGQVRGLVTIAGNPALAAPNAAALSRAIERLDTYVAIDFYVNETTRHAHLILPPTCSLEQDNYELIFHGFAARDTAKYSPAVLEPEAGTRHDWQILREFASRLFEKKAPNALVRFVARAVFHLGLVPTPRRMLDLLLRFGPYGAGLSLIQRGLRLRDLELEPQGVDLGAPKPALDRILRTKSGALALDEPRMLGEIARVRVEWLEGPSDRDASETLLIGRRAMRSHNSWLGNTRMATQGSDPCTLWVHPEDAARLGIEDGGLVGVRSRTGALEARAQITDAIMAGVVSLPHGWGHDLPGVEMRVATAQPGVNGNLLTDDRVLEGVVGNAIFNGVPVHVRAGGVD